jgi:DNA-binding transcriptional regulator YiaG
MAAVKAKRQVVASVSAPARAGELAKTLPTSTPKLSLRTGKGKHQRADAQVTRAPQLIPSVELVSTAQFVADVRCSLGVNRELFARMTGFSVRAISGWEAGRPLSEPALRRVKEMKRLSDALADGLRPEFIAQWLITPSEGLGGLKPVEVLERGETDRLWRVVLLIGSGMPI